MLTALPALSVALTAEVKALFRWKLSRLQCICEPIGSPDLLFIEQQVGLFYITVQKVHDHFHQLRHSTSRRCSFDDAVQDIAGRTHGHLSIPSTFVQSPHRRDTSLRQS